MNRARRLLVLPWIVIACSCAVHHGKKNAPGHIAVHDPPGNPERKRAELPGDPGENMVALTYGALAGGGLGFQDEETKGSFGVGPEVSVHVGRSRTSHTDDSFVLLPERSLGINLGWTLLFEPGDGVGPAYSELQYSEQPYWLAGGWAWDADDQLHGPHVTLGIGFFYVSYMQLLDATGALHAGVVIKGHQTWVWSR